LADSSLHCLLGPNGPRMELGAVGEIVISILHGE